MARLGAGRWGFESWKGNFCSRMCSSCLESQQSNFFVGLEISTAISG